ncbi:hypothetical protein ACU4GD_36310, partial [Cupriavidus basilensis]
MATGTGHLPGSSFQLIDAAHRWLRQAQRLCPQALHRPAFRGGGRLNFAFNIARFHVPRPARRRAGVGNGDFAHTAPLRLGFVLDNPDE